MSVGHNLLINSGCDVALKRQSSPGEFVALELRLSVMPQAISEWLKLARQSRGELRDVVLGCTEKENEVGAVYYTTRKNANEP